MRAHNLQRAVLCLCLAAPALLACRKTVTPCLSSAMCGDGICSGGFCEVLSDPNSTTSGGGVIPPATDGGTLSDAGSGGTDGAVVGGDAAVVIVSMPVTPVALALSDTGGLLTVATGGTGTPMVLYNRPVPITGAPLTVTLATAGADCALSWMVLRGANLFTACVDQSSFPRVFNVSTGAQVGLASMVPVAANPVMVDHEKMVGVASAVSTGGTGYPNPVTDATAQLTLGNFDAPTNIGVGFVEGASGTILGMVSASQQPGFIAYWTLSGSTFSPGAPIPVSAIPAPELITSGRPVTGASPALQPVLLLAGATQTAVLYDGTALKNASTGSALSPVKTFTGLALPFGASMRVKISQDSLYAYYFSTAAELCRIPLTGSSTAAECHALTVGCAPVDMAPHIRSSPTFVACTGNGGFLEAHPAF